jgi:hypothetical protein
VQEPLTIRILILSGMDSSCTLTFYTEDMVTHKVEKRTEKSELFIVTGVTLPPWDALTTLMPCLPAALPAVRHPVHP